MAERVEAAINADLLSWAREEARLGIAQAAKKLCVKPERLGEWERGTKRPTITQLRKIAALYHRPIAVFYLDARPTTFRPMHDYRRLPGEVAGEESPVLHLQVRRAYERRDVALELLSALGEPPPEFRLAASLGESPETVAARVRAFLNVSLETQGSWKNDREAFNAWRGAFESREVLVFQAVKVAVKEARGFSISETPLPVLIVNRKDSLRGRIFTLFHEFAHVLLRDGGLCDLEEDGQRDHKDEAIEVFCNAVAAAALVPRSALLDHAVIWKHGAGRAAWSDDDLLILARAFNVSTEAILRRLLTLGRTTADFYRAKREEFLREVTATQKKKGRGLRPDQETLSTAGRLYVRLVLQGYYHERITSSDLADYLSIRLNHLQKIERAVGDTAPDTVSFL